jgi:disulfide bond formation protein DsbB
MKLAALFQPRPSFLAVLLVSVGALGAALIGQTYFGLKPCELCIYQRVPYALLIVGSLISLIMYPKAEKLFLILFTVLFFASAAVAVFHVGVEQHWWSLESGCKVGELKGKTEAEILAEILATPQVQCDKAGWVFLGLSITVWNTALSLVMAGYLMLVRLNKKNA